MKVFRYKARNRENFVVNDIIEAVDKGDAVRKLKNNSLVPLELSELKVSKLGEGLNISLTSGISKKDLVFFLSQLYNLLHAGLGIIDALKIIIDQTQNKYLKKYLVDMLQDIRNGSSLYDAMVEQKKAFPKLMIEMIKVGEAIGNLEQVTKDLHMYYEKQMKTAQDIKGAMMYPVILLIATVAVTTFLMIAVIPQIQSSLESSGQELPAATKMVIATSEFLQNHSIPFFSAVLVVIIGLILFNKTEQGSQIYSKIAINVPIFGKVNRKGNLVRISRTFSTLLKNKVNAVEALTITKNTLNNKVFIEIVEKSQINLENGIPLSKAYEKQKVIDPVFVSMLQIGEETATMEEMLESLAEYYDTEMETQVNTLKKLMEPVMIMILTMVVGVIILAIMTPMFNMMG
jgi:type IV pilus assembly protein PilC